MRKTSVENKITCLDFETTGLTPYDGARPFIVGMETEEGKVCIARPDNNDRGWETFENLVQDPRSEKLCHNAKFEIKMSRHLGLLPKGKFHDTMALAVLVNEYQPLSLDGLSIKHFKDFSKDAIKAWLKANKKAFIKKHGREPNYSDVPSEILVSYLEGDLDKTLRLFWLFYPVVCANPKIKAIYDMETELAYDIVDMEDRGVRVDLPKTLQLIKELKPRQKALVQEIYEEVGFKFNLASPVQLGRIFEELGIDTGERTKSGLPKTAYDLIKDLMDVHPFIKKFVTWRTMQKMLTTYLIPFTQQNYGETVYPNFWQYGKDKAIVTGRFSSTDPSFHTIPSRAKGDNPELIKLGGIVKECIIPRPGYAFVFFDFKQIEMRLFAHYTKEEALIKKIKSGVDPYLATAHILFGEKFMNGLKGNDFDTWRDRAKTVSLAFIYGMGKDKLAKRLKYTAQKAMDIKRKFFNGLIGARDWAMQLQRDIMTKGYCEDIFGRRYHVPVEQCYKGVNAVCQGTAAIVMKKTILKARPLRKYGAYPILTIHDELVLEVPIPMVDTVAIEGKKLLEDRTTFSVPLEVDVEVSYTNWKEKTKWKKQS